MRACVYRLRGRQSILLLVFDHLVCDGWSFWRLVDELGEILEDTEAAIVLARGGGPEEDYFAFVRHERHWLKGKQAEKQFTYWREALAEQYPVLGLPTDRPRVLAPSPKCDFVVFTLPPELANALRQLAKRHGTTLYVVLLSAYFILLHRLSGQDRIAIGSPMPARGNGRWDDVAGTFINAVPLRVFFDPDLTVETLLRIVRGSAFRALRNQDYPLTELVERLNPARNQGHSPYFQTLFVFQNPRGAAKALALMVSGVGGRDRTTVRWGGYDAAYWREPTDRVTTLDLELEVIEAGEEILGRLEYATALFEHETAERWLGYLRRVLEAMAADETQAVERIALLSEAERERVVYEWNATDAEYPSDKCIHELFEEQAARTPDAVAVVFEDQSLSYGELNGRANRLAHYLRGLGVKPDERVAICVERGLDMVAGLLAILKAGGAYVPLDPAYPAERLAYMLADSAPVALLTDATGQAALAGCMGTAPAIDLAADAALWAAEPGGNPGRASIGLMPAHLAYVIYTSGSTGTPKGVMIEHRSVVQPAWPGCRSVRRLTPVMSCCNGRRCSFDASVWEIYSRRCWRAPGWWLSVPRALTASPGTLLVRLFSRRASLSLQFVPSSASCSSLRRSSRSDCTSIRVVCSAAARRCCSRALSSWAHASLGGASC